MGKMGLTRILVTDGLQEGRGLVTVGSDWLVKDHTSFILLKCKITGPDRVHEGGAKSQLSKKNTCSPSLFWIKSCVPSKTLPFV